MDVSEFISAWDREAKEQGIDAVMVAADPETTTYMVRLRPGHLVRFNMDGSVSIDMTDAHSKQIEQDFQVIHNLWQHTRHMAEALEKVRHDFAKVAHAWRCAQKQGPHLPGLPRAPKED